jgi:hypothetical protein
MMLFGNAFEWAPSFPRPTDEAEPSILDKPNTILKQTDGIAEKALPPPNLLETWHPPCLRCLERAFYVTLEERAEYALDFHLTEGVSLARRWASPVRDRLPTAAVQTMVECSHATVLAHDASEPQFVQYVAKCVLCHVFQIFSRASSTNTASSEFPVHPSFQCRVLVPHRWIILNPRRAL